MTQRIVVPLFALAVLSVAAAMALLAADGGGGDLPVSVRCTESGRGIGPVKRSFPGGSHVITTTGLIQDHYLGLGDLRSFSWSPDGNGLAYVVHRELADAESNFLPANPYKSVPSLPFVQAIDVRDGSSLLPPRPGGTPHWSPDGQWIVYQALPGEGEEDEKVVCLASLVDPSQVRTIAIGYELPSKDAHLPMQRPVWSPDGTRVLLFDNSRNLHVLNVSTGDSPIRLWEEPVNGTNWSPEGSRVAVTSSAGSIERGLSGIWIIDANADEGNATQIGQGRQPTWTLDGGEIVTFLHPELTIEILNASTGVVERSVEGSLPALSPDGTQLAYVSEWSFRGDPVNLFVLDLVTNETTQLTAFESSFIETPSWSADGSTIAFYAGGAEVPSGVYRVWPEFADSLNYIQNAVDHVTGLTWSPDSNHIVFSFGGAHD